MNGFLLRTGDAREEMAKFDKEIARVATCSPPYYGLRSYGGVTTRQFFGGEEFPECQHNWIETFGPNMTGGTGAASAKQVTNKGSQFGNEQEEEPSRLCTYCGKWWGELGREPTPELYIAHLAEIFDGVRRVLTADGTLWINIADCYAGSGKGPTGHNGIGNQEQRQGFKSRGVSKIPLGYKAKDLYGIPFMLAFALRSQGWYWRQVNVWEKQNPFPESVRDRSSTAHEYVLQFSKSKTYYYDYDAVAEPIEPFRDQNGTWRTHKNRRSVWTFKTQPVKGHTAVFPEKLPALCILAGSEQGDIVLDPFSGSATTGVVALKLRRHYIGIDIIPEYNKLGALRLAEARPQIMPKERRHRSPGAMLDAMKFEYNVALKASAPV